MSIPQQTRWAALAVAGLTAFSAPAWADKVRLATSMGEIVIELDAQKAPKSVANFEQYVKEGHYDGTVFHRVIPNFMVQGGGMLPNLKEKPTHKPIALEADNGLNNVKGSVAMARTMRGRDRASFSAQSCKAATARSIAVGQSVPESCRPSPRRTILE